MQPVEYQLLSEAEQTHWWFKALRLFLERYLPDGPDPALRRLALDIGCGTGAWMRHLADQGYRVVGVDYSPLALELARKDARLLLVRASADRLPFHSSFDLVTSIDVLEVSSVDAAGLAKSVVRALKPEGVGIILAAAFQWLLSEHDRAVDSVHRYTIGELRSLFSTLPVRLTAATYVYCFLFPLIALHKLINRPKKGKARSDIELPAEWVNRLLFWVCKLEAAFLPSVRFPFGSSVLVRIQK